MPTTIRLLKFFYICMQKFVLKPYFLKRKKQKALDNMEKTSAEVRLLPNLFSYIRKSCNVLPSRS